MTRIAHRCDWPSRVDKRGKFGGGGGNRILSNTKHQPGDPPCNSSIPDELTELCKRGRPVGHLIDARKYPIENLDSPFAVRPPVVQDEDGARANIPEELFDRQTDTSPEIHRVGRGRYRRVPVLPHDPGDPLRYHAATRSAPAGRSERLDQPVRPFQLLEKLLVRQGRAHPVGEEVVGEFVSIGADGFDQFGMRLCVGTDDEECGPGPMLAQHAKNSRSHLGMRRVIDGQCNQAFRSDDSKYMCSSLSSDWGHSRIQRKPGCRPLGTRRWFSLRDRGRDRDARAGSRGERAGARRPARFDVVIFVGVTPLMSKEKQSSPAGATVVRRHNLGGRSWWRCWHATGDGC